MFKNVNMFTVVLILSATCFAPCLSLQCYQNIMENATCRLNDNKSLSVHCITQKNSTSLDWTNTCDDDHLCEGKQDGVNYHVCHGEVMMTYHCCSQDLCNKDHQLLDISHHNFTCSPELPCTSTYCVNTTLENTTGIIINTSVDCFHGQATKPNNPIETLVLPNGDVRKEFLLNFSMICNNLTASTTHHMPTPVSSMTTRTSPMDRKNGFSAGVVIGAVLVMATGLMLVGIGVKKCYERHLNRRLEYSYAQLTIDMLDDDDDHLILP